jgi:polyphosphate kinase
MDTFDFNQPDLYIGRELSLVEFNRRVLAQASDPQVPLLERLRYMCITSINIDEMFEVRIAGLKQKVELGSVQRGPENLAPHETLRLLSELCHKLVDEQYRVLNDELLPALEEENIRFIRRTEWTTEQAEWLENFFQQQLLPVLSPTDTKQESQLYCCPEGEGRLWPFQWHGHCAGTPCLAAPDSITGKDGCGAV